MNIARFLIDYCARRRAPLSHLRLQHLLYIGWIDYFKNKKTYLFPDDFHAWKSGPVVPEIYHEYWVYGGRPIDMEYALASLAGEDTAILATFLEKNMRVSARALVKNSCKEGSAWFAIYRNGEGTNRVIPKTIILNDAGGNVYDA